MKTKFDSLISSINHYGTFLSIITSIIAWIGYEKNKQMVFYSALAVIIILVMIGLYNLARIGYEQNNARSFLRTYFNSEEWRKTKKEIGFRSISIANNPDASKIRREALIEEAIFYVLRTKKNLTYNKANSMIEDLIEDDGLNI